MTPCLIRKGIGNVPLINLGGVNAGKLRTDIEQALEPRLYRSGRHRPAMVQPFSGFSADPQPLRPSGAKEKDNFISSELFVSGALEARGTLTRPFKIRRSNNRQP